MVFAVNILKYHKIQKLMWLNQWLKMIILIKLQKLKRNLDSTLIYQNFSPCFKIVYVYKDWEERISTGDFHLRMRDASPLPKIFRENTMSPIKMSRTNPLIINNVWPALKRQNIPLFLAPAPCGKNRTR